MKHKLICAAALALAFLVHQSAKAQQATQDLKISYGFAPSPAVGAAFWHQLFGSNGSLRTVGPVGLEYTYHLSDRAALGVSGSYAQITYRETSGSTSASAVKRQSKYYTLLPQLQVYLGNKEKLEAYSAVALGVSYERFTANQEMDSSERNWIMAYQVTGMGIRTKARTAFSAEIGYGYKGILNLGISRRL